jgi:hypothetical protein
MLGAGLDSAELVSQLRAAHAGDSASRAGIDVILGEMGDMKQLGIFESFKVSRLGQRPFAISHEMQASHCSLCSRWMQPVTSTETNRIQLAYSACRIGHLVSVGQP